MIKYPKINSVFKRNVSGKFTDEFSTKEIDFLSDKPWIASEKVDGTNIRIGYYLGKFKIEGRTERAQIPADLLELLNGYVTLWKENNVFDTNKEVVIFGEGYGGKIQGNPYDRMVSFIVFDVWISGLWLKHDAVVEVSNELDIDTVKTCTYGYRDIWKAIDEVKNGKPSLYGECKAEGLVLEPLVPLKDRLGNRIITKIKTGDFK